MRPGGQRLRAKYVKPGQQVGYWSTESRLSKVTAALMAQLGAGLRSSGFSPLPLSNMQSLSHNLSNGGRETLLLQCAYI